MNKVYKYFSTETILGCCADYEEMGNDCIGELIKKFTAMFTAWITNIYICIPCLKLDVRKNQANRK